MVSAVFNSFIPSSYALTFSFIGNAGSISFSRIALALVIFVSKLSLVLIVPPERNSLFYQFLLKKRHVRNHFQLRDNHCSFFQWLALQYELPPSLRGEKGCLFQIRPDKVPH